MDTDRMRRIAEIDALIREHDADIKALKAERQSLEEAALEDLGEAGVQSVAVTVGDGKRTVYIKRRVDAHNLIGPAETAEALVKAGYGHMVEPRANANSVSALIRELEASPDGLPPEFEGVIAPHETFKIATRAS